MLYGFVLPSGDARTAADFTQLAEKAGWDAIFVWSRFGALTPGSA